VLLHNANKFPSVPLALAANTKESYENTKLLLEKIQYEKYNWNIYGDSKVIAVLLGLQLGCTKFCCFLCVWDIRDRKHQYIQKQWNKRESLLPGHKSIVNTSLINREKVYLPPLHIKIGLIKNFVKIAQVLCRPV
jgi:hypothetical protein